MILHIGTSNLKNKESVEDIANDIMDVAIFIRNEKTNVFASVLTFRNDIEQQRKECEQLTET